MIICWYLSSLDILQDLEITSVIKLYFMHLVRKDDLDKMRKVWFHCPSLPHVASMYSLLNMANGERPAPDRLSQER